MTVVKVTKADGQVRDYTEVEENELQRRSESDEPLFDEDREVFVDDNKKADEERSEKAKELGLAEDATDEDIENKKLEDKEAGEAELKERAKKVGLSEDATEEEINSKEKETSGGDDDFKTFENADDQTKQDLIAQKEVELENEEDEDNKKDIQSSIDKMKSLAVKEPKKIVEEDDIDSEIKQYSEEKEVSEEDAREAIKSRNSIIKKYDGDVKKVAMANRSLQREYTKVKSELDNTVKTLEQVKIESELSGDMLPEDIINGPGGRKFSKEELIGKYRESYPGLSENMEDGAVYDLIRKDVRDKLISNRTKDMAVNKGSAKARRMELISTLPKEAEPYRENIKKMLDNCPDNQIVSKTFNLDDIIKWNKGNDFDEAVSEAEKRGYKRGFQNRKIVGERKNSDGSSKTKAVKSGDAKAFGLDDNQKKEALVFFSEHQIPETRKFELYADRIKFDKELEAKRKDK